MATWAMRQRYAWIDARLAAGKSFNRDDLVQAFVVTKQTASATIAQYTALQPDALRYDANAKAFVRADAPSAPKGLTGRERRMLAALKSLDAEVVTYAMAKDIGHEGSALLEAVSEARAAIANAEGRS